MRLYVILRNLRNKLIYGINAPRHSQRIYAKVSEQIPFLPPEAQPYAVRPHRLSGLIVGGDWDNKTASIYTCPKVKFSLMHWQQGIPWAETGCFEYLLEIIRQRGRVDGLRTLDDIKARYYRLDQVYKQVKNEGKLRNASELGRARKKNLENSGILIHLDRQGNPIFGGSGCHRIAMAISLGIQIIPAKLGLVHADYLSEWHNVLRR
ncbi:hypothetical protein [Desulfonatronovibrio hydrogenovorans]|uniref:hypothetical protein n=1 Tax=Desulfonatronovibrio hydrogenovorans TaxID=53245 RepID=UPI000491A8BC|nr:hypothetical protein [Desulfonatronovibrio hydrogenovorans]